ncbi:MAG: DNA alkylation repair protein [Paracoccaceae bacterium]
MAEPFKNWFGPDMVRAISTNLARASDRFDAALFERLALKDLDRLELKQRSQQFSHAVEAAMPGTFEQCIGAMIAALHPQKDAAISDMRSDDTGLANFALMPLSAFVARNGLNKPAFSLRALREMTMRGSSEFDVRPFFRDHAEITLKAARGWAKDANLHVRRLASEGSRPRLPWGIRLHDFVRDPGPILPILTALRDDPQEYVRRSVANNLNDIAKDHPDLVAGIAVNWLRGASRDRARLVKHACRSLIKTGHAGALAAFGFGAPDLTSCSVVIGSERIKLGDNLEISLAIAAGHGPQKLAIDYVLHFLRANGRQSAKVFKWCELTLAGGESRTLSKTHPYRKVTTRRDYAGIQRLTVQINGVDMGGADFELEL